jgi:hypothetical protein
MLSSAAYITTTFESEFLVHTGDHVGKKTVKSDADLPPIAGGKGK